MHVTAADAPRYETPNAVMRTLAAPSLGASDLSVWEVVMRAGQRGPEHQVDREQVWTVLEGELRVDADGEALPLRAGETLRLAPGTPRRISADTDARAVVASPAGSIVTTAEGGSRALPWAT